MVVVTVVDHDIAAVAHIIAISMMAERLQGVTVSEPTAQQFLTHLGIQDPSGFSQQTDLESLCKMWLAQVEREHHPAMLIEALILTRGLGRHASELACMSGSKDFTYAVQINSVLSYFRSYLFS